VNYSHAPVPNRDVQQISRDKSTASIRRPPDLPPASLMDTVFAIIGPLVRRRRPQIQFLSIGPYLCSTLPSDPTSR